ncbi:MAG: hypothetical protein DMG06_19090 [Acidobacteria bacterium]|nr:MAG: hypothetical protein DMG06_19090 [Acidobacteriota bacterium]
MFFVSLWLICFLSQKTSFLNIALRIRLSTVNFLVLLFGFWIAAGLALIVSLLGDDSGAQALKKKPTAGSRSKLLAKLSRFSANSQINGVPPNSIWPRWFSRASAAPLFALPQKSSFDLKTAWKFSKALPTLD